MAPTLRYECTECPKAFPYLSHLTRHMIVHKSEKEFECDACHKFFPRVEALTRHKRTMHATPVGTPQNDEDADERPYVCETCGLGYKYRQNLHEHKKTHEPSKKIQCPRCRKYLSRKSAFPRHQRSCLGARSADAGSAVQAASLADETADDLEETRVDQDAAFGEGISMLEGDDASTSSDSDSSNVFVAPAPPNDEVADADPTEAAEQEPMINAEFCEVMDETTMDGSFPVRQHNGNITQYRAPSDSSDDDGDDADAQSNDEQPSTLFFPFAQPATVSQARPDVDADFAAFSALENVFRRRVQSLEDQFQRLTLRQWMPLETLRDAFAFLSRVDLTKASTVCRRYRNLSSTFDTLRHIANLVVEPVARGQRFGNHPGWPILSKSSVVLWYELGPERAPGAFRTFQTVPKALEFVAQQGLLQEAYVENLIFRQTGAGDIPNYVWQHLGRSLTTTEIGQWTIDGLRLEAVAKFGNVHGPFDAVKSLRSRVVRNCPYLRIQ